MRLIGIAGVAGSGKSELAKRLVEKFYFVSLALADPLKEFCKQVFDFSDEQLWGPSEKRNEPDKRYLRIRRGANGTVRGPWNSQLEAYDKILSPPEDVYLTPRYALQTLGTEWGRDCCADIWVKLAMRKASRYQLVAIPDVRFRNEAEAIRAAGGSIWLVERPGAGLSEEHQHKSENALDGFEPDLVLHNKSTLYDFHALIDEVASRWLAARDAVGSTIAQQEVAHAHL